VSTCIHQKVCKHFSENEILECALEDVCKHHAKDYSDIEPETRPLAQPKKNKGGKGSDDLLALFKKAKVFIAMHRGDLDENQKAAVDAMSGKHYSSLTDEQRKQLIEIAAYLKKAKG
jgi:hypothetical protein